MREHVLLNRSVCVRCADRCHQTLEENGGAAAFKQIKAKVPTYTTAFI